MRSPVPTVARTLAALAAPSLLSLVLLPTAGATPCAMQRATRADAAADIATPPQPQPLQLAGNRKRGNNDDNFDPYGKDDPTSKRWGSAVGAGNRYGGLNTGGNAKPKNEKNDKNADREERGQRQVREEE